MTKCPHCGYEGRSGITTLAYFETGPDKNWKYCPKCKKRIDNVSHEFRSPSLEKQNAAIREFNRASRMLSWLSDIATELQRASEATCANEDFEPLKRIINSSKEELEEAIKLVLGMCKKASGQE